MRIDPTEPAAEQVLEIHQGEHLGVIGLDDLRKCRQQFQNLAAALQAATGEFPDNERVTLDFAALEMDAQPWVPASEVVDPNGTVYEH